MSCVRKIVSEQDINASAEKYYKIFKHEISHVPKISPKWIQHVKVHGGDWNNHGHGSLKTWNYTVDGKAESFKERVEYDDKNLSISLIGLEGDVFKRYKIFNPIYKVVPKGPKQCSVVLTIEYEKHDDSNCPCPYKYLDLMCGITKDIESHLK